MNLTEMQLSVFFNNSTRHETAIPVTVSKSGKNVHKIRNLILNYLFFDIGKIERFKNG